MFIDILTQHGVDATLAARCEKFWALVKAKNAVMNLTAVTDDDEAALRHFADSLELLKLPEFPGGRVIDVGTGAGFPGVPLALARADMSVTLADSLNKRVAFLEEACAELSLGCECVHGRAEELSLEKSRRDGYDAAVSRAVAQLNVLCELCLPFVKVGGVFLAMKSAESEDEINAAKGAIKKLGGQIERVAEYELGGVVRKVVVVRKHEPTPPGYPRRFAKIQKQPL